MKVAVPVFDEGLDIFKNTGHSPYFAIFELKGTGAFKSFSLIEMRKNPRGDKESEQGCSHGAESREEHIKGHSVLADIVKDIDVVLIQSACKNTAFVMEEAGAMLAKIPQNIQKAKDALAFVYTKQENT